MDLNTPLVDVSFQFKRYKSKLDKLNLNTVEDLIMYPPARYIDYTIISDIDKIQPGEIVTLKGKILKINNIFTRYKKNFQQAILSDGNSEIFLIWFNQPYLTKVIKHGSSLSVSGKVDFFGNKLAIISPDYEGMDFSTDTIHTGRLVPKYHETKGISSKWIRRQIFSLLSKIEIEETLPIEFLEKYNLINKNTSIQKMHFPDDINVAISAKNRLAFEELLNIVLESQYRKKILSTKNLGRAFDVSSDQKKVDNLISSLPYKLTSGQIKAVGEITKDLSTSIPMNRLLQGDVGSGKTVVATIAMYLSCLNGYQSTLLAPTEILAIQHFKTINEILKNLNIKIGLQTGSKKSLSKTDPNNFDILIGTHALLNESISFDNLGLIVIDEQQRFGVNQRKLLREKAINPHFLTMTATPIPRTVALTLFSDLDLSMLEELPSERKKIKTWLVSNDKRKNAYAWIEDQIEKFDSQAFIICPLIEESESLKTVKAVEVEYKNLKENIFPKKKLALLHGKMKPKDKNTILEDFNLKKYDILVSTPVVEVGIDIKSATIILIEAAERFGLAQLHQLRGRVGRSEKQSYCLLFTESTSQVTLNKLKSLETIKNGAKLAELDLKLRGPGEIFGTRQSGIPTLKFADFNNEKLIKNTKEAAQLILKNINSYPQIKSKLISSIEKRSGSD